MTNKDAIWVLTHIDAHGLAAEARDMAILALKKSIPLSVIDLSGDCPACHADEFYTMYDMLDSNHYNYCANCGQRLDWSKYNKRRGLDNDNK